MRDAVRTDDDVGPPAAFVVAFGAPFDDFPPSSTSAPTRAFGRAFARAARPRATGPVGKFAATTRCADAAASVSASGGGGDVYTNKPMPTSNAPITRSWPE